MKLKSTILSTVCLVTLLFGCKKENAMENKDIYGRWRLIQVYDEWGSGGTPKWSSVPDENSWSLVFLANREYKKIANQSG